MKLRKLNSIRIKLIISLVAMCIIPLLIVGFSSYYQSKVILSNKLTLTSTQTLTEISDGLDNYFNGFSDIVDLTANNPPLMESANNNNNEMLTQILKGVKESDEDIVSIYYATASGKFLAYPALELSDGYNPTTRPWYKQALDNKGEATITPAYVDAISGKSIVSIVRTVEKDGQVVGVVGMDVALTTLAEKISTKQVGNSGYVVIAETSGNVLAHPQEDFINTNEVTKLPFWNEAESEDNGFVKYIYDGKSKFGVFQTNKLTGWKLIATLDESELTDDTKSILHTTFLIILVMGLIALALSFLLSKGIASNIKKLKEVFAKASDGDLTVSVTASTKDEFHDLAISFNKMMKNIAVLMNNVTKSSRTVLETSTSLASMSEEVTASISEVAKSIEEVSAGATDQAQNAQDGASEMDGLANKLDEISENSKKMDKISSDTYELGAKGLDMIDTLIEKSNKTKVATTEVDKIVRDMNESTRQINTISETIADISAQTNLLSLNASIESARAGEAGKGFAVVAEEIRKLAEQSKTSTEEIKEIIASIQGKSETAVDAIKSTESVVKEQDLAVKQTQEIFNEILKSIEVMITKVDEVKISIIDVNEKKQSTVSKIENISAVSEQTAAASQEVTASTEEITATMEELTTFSSELQTLAEQLGSEISKFKI